MPIKDDRIEFRCTTAMKCWLQGCRPAVGARSLSQAARTLLERMMENVGTANAWGAVPALKEVALHLDRIAGALQRSALEGTALEETLRDLHAVLGRIRALLDGATCQRSAEPRPVRRGRG